MNHAINKVQKFKNLLWT